MCKQKFKKTNKIPKRDNPDDIHPLMKEKISQRGNLEWSGIDPAFWSPARKKRRGKHQIRLLLLLILIPVHPERQKRFSGGWLMAKRLQTLHFKSFLSFTIVCDQHSHIITVGRISIHTFKGRVCLGVVCTDHLAPRQNFTNEWTKPVCCVSNADGNI